MKKKFLSIGVILLSFFSVRAQTEFGLKAGVNFASYSYGDTEQLVDAKPRASFYLAGYLDAPIAKNIYIQPEFSLQGKGAKLIEDINSGGGEINQRVMWLDVAVNLLGKMPLDNFGNVFVGAGPYMGFAINGENDYASGTTTSVIIYQDNALKSVDYGLNFSTGMKFGKRLFFNVNYRMGLANIANKNYKWSDTIKNRVFSVGVGVVL